MRRRVGGKEKKQGAWSATCSRSQVPASLGKTGSSAAVPGASGAPILVVERMAERNAPPRSSELYWKNVGNSGRGRFLKKGFANAAGASKFRLPDAALNESAGCEAERE